MAINPKCYDHDMGDLVLRFDEPLWLDDPSVYAWLAIVCPRSFVGAWLDDGHRAVGTSFDGRGGSTQRGAADEALVGSAIRARFWINAQGPLGGDLGG